MEKVSHAPVRRLCCKDMGSEVPSIEASCGMLMMWDKYLIESRVGIEGSILPCNKVQFYAEGQKSNVHRCLWAKLLIENISGSKSIEGFWNLPWNIEGISRTIRYAKKKKGILVTKSMKNFDELIQHLELLDFSIEGAEYTWSVTGYNSFRV